MPVLKFRTEITRIPIDCPLPLLEVHVGVLSSAPKLSIGMGVSTSVNCGTSKCVLVIRIGQAFDRCMVDARWGCLKIIFSSNFTAT